MITVSIYTCLQSIAHINMSHLFGFYAEREKKEHIISIRSDANHIDILNASNFEYGDVCIHWRAVFGDNLSSFFVDLRFSYEFQLFLLFSLDKM